MHHVPDDAGLEAGVDALPHTKHFKAAYRLACYYREGTVILRLVRVDSDYPTRVQWRFPVEIGYQGTLIQVLDDWTLEVMGSTDGIINP